MNKKNRKNTQYKARKNIPHASRFMNQSLTLEDFSTNRMNLEFSLKNVFSRFENESDNNKQVIFY